MSAVVVVRRALWAAIGACFGLSADAATMVAACRTSNGETKVGIVDAGHRAGEGCDIRRIDVERDDIIWAGALPRLPQTGEEVVLVSAKGRPKRAEIRPIATLPPKAPALPLVTPLLPRTTMRLFGAEGRGTAEIEGGRLALTCRAGAHPAGVVLDPGDARPPRGANVGLLATHQGDAGFALSVVPAGQDAEGGTALLPGTTPRETRIATAQAGDGVVQFVLLCPKSAARIVLHDLALVPPPAGRQPSAAWVWEVAQWRDTPEELLERAAARSIDRLHVALDIGDEGVRHSSRLSRFVALASARGIAVDAVEGDPEMVRPAGARHAIVRARAIAAYQRGAPPYARLAGVQYDIEPYLLPEFGSDRSAMLSAWSRVLVDLSDTLSMPIDVVVPFWLIDLPEGVQAMDRLAPRLRQVTVMCYRTDPEQVVMISEPSLAWAAARDVPVRIALEMGAVEDEREESFHPAPRGRVLVTKAGAAAAVLLLRDEAAVPGGLSLGRRQAVDIPAGRISFLGDEVAMLSAAGRLQHVLPAWPSFGGFSFHGLFEQR